MTLGNLAAFFQQNVKRLLSYSTISQVGYLLMPVAVAGHADLSQQALLLYLAGYALTNLVTAYAAAVGSVVLGLAGGPVPALLDGSLAR